MHSASALTLLLVVAKGFATEAPLWLVPSDDCTQVYVKMLVPQAVGFLHVIRPFPGMDDEDFAWSIDACNHKKYSIQADNCESGADGVICTVLLKGLISHHPYRIDYDTSPAVPNVANMHEFIAPWCHVTHTVQNLASCNASYSWRPDSNDPEYESGRLYFIADMSLSEQSVGTVTAMTAAVAQDLSYACELRGKPALRKIMCYSGNTTAKLVGGDTS